MEGHRSASAKGGHLGMCFQAFLSLLLLLSPDSLACPLLGCYSFLAPLLLAPSIVSSWHLRAVFKNAQPSVSIFVSVFPTGLSMKICHSSACKACLSGSCCPAPGPLHLLSVLCVMPFPCLLSSFRAQFSYPFHGESSPVAQPNQTL